MSNHAELFRHYELMAERVVRQLRELAEDVEVNRVAVDPKLFADDEHELQELKAEVERHHVGFRNIQRICDTLEDLLDNDEEEFSDIEFRDCLRRIRNVVG